MTRLNHALITPSITPSITALGVMCNPIRYTAQPVVASRRGAPFHEPGVPPSPASIGPRGHGLRGGACKRAAGGWCGRIGEGKVWGELAGVGEGPSGEGLNVALAH